MRCRLNLTKRLPFLGVLPLRPQAVKTGGLDSTRQGIGIDTFARDKISRGAFGAFAQAYGISGNGRAFRLSIKLLQRMSVSILGNSILGKIQNFLLNRLKVGENLTGAPEREHATESRSGLLVYQFEMSRTHINLFLHTLARFSVNHNHCPAVTV